MYWFCRPPLQAGWGAPLTPEEKAAEQQGKACDEVEAHCVVLQKMTWLTLETGDKPKCTSVAQVVQDANNAWVTCAYGPDFVGPPAEFPCEGVSEVECE